MSWNTPEINDRIIEFCRDNPDDPKSNGNAAISLMLIREFHVFVGTNAIAGRVHRLGILRRRPRVYPDGEGRLAATLARDADRRMTDPRRRKRTDEELTQRAEDRRLKAQAKAAARDAARQAAERKRLDAGPDPDLTATPEPSRRHDIAQFMRQHHAAKQDHRTVPRVTLSDVQPQPIATPISKASARRRECCWPIGEPGTREFRYCDAPNVNVGSYCDEHARLAYVRKPKPSGDFMLRSPMAPR